MNRLPDLPDWTFTDSGMNLLVDGILFEIYSELDGLWHAYMDGTPVGVSQTPDLAINALRQIHAVLLDGMSSAD